MLQQGPATRGRRCRDVQLRIYLLSELRGDDAGWALPELWRRIGGSSQTPGREAGAVSCIHRARGQIGRLRRTSA